MKSLGKEREKKVVGIWDKDDLKEFMKRRRIIGSTIYDLKDYRKVTVTVEEIHQSQERQSHGE